MSTDLVERLRARKVADFPRGVLTPDGLCHDAATALESLQSEVERLTAERDEAQLQQKAWADKWDHAVSELERLRNAIAVKGGGEHAPTEWAYLKACEAIEKHRTRADTAEASLAAERRRVEELQDTNRRLNRRLQELESLDAKALRETGYWDLRAQVAAYRARQASFVDFDRLMRAYGEMKKCYEAAAKVLGLPYGKYLSVMDATRGENGGTVHHSDAVCAIVYIDYPRSDTETHPVVETVIRALELASPYTPAALAVKQEG